MTRYSGEFSGACLACGEYVEFALGIRPGTDPVAAHFGPGGPTPVQLDELQLATMIDEALDVRFRFRCPLCQEWTTGRCTCRAAGESTR